MGCRNLNDCQIGVAKFTAGFFEIGRSYPGLFAESFADKFPPKRT